MRKEKKPDITNKRALVYSVLIATAVSLIWFYLVDNEKPLKVRVLVTLTVFATLVGGISVILIPVIAYRPFVRLLNWIRKIYSRSRNSRPRLIIHDELEEFVGREEEIILLYDKLTKLSQSPFAICFFGFGGIGKTRVLLEYYNRIVREEHHITPLYGPVPRITFGEHEGKAGESVAGYLSRLLNLPESDSTDQFDKLEKIIPSLDSYVVLVDEFPYDDLEFTNHFEWLLRQMLTKIGYRVLFVTASRGEPLLSTSTPAIIKQLQGLTPNQLRRFIADNQWPSKDFQQEVLENFDDFYLFTNGNPQVAKLILGSQPSWGAVRDVQSGMRISDINNLDKLLNEVWGAIKGEQIRDDLRMLTVASQLAVEWSEKLAQFLVPDWPSTKNELRRRALLNRSSSGNYKIHDLLAAFVYSNISNIAFYHRRVSEYYIQECYLQPNEPADSVLAARHAILADDVNLLQQIYPLLSHFLFGKGEVRTLEQILVKAKPLIDKSQDKSFIAITARDLAKAHLNLGETAAALDEYERARHIFVDFDLLSDSEEAELLTGMADCYRLRGRLSEARGSFQRARELFSKAGEEAKAIAAYIEFGHSYFLAGEITDSLRVYDQILSQLDERKQPNLLADLYYRRSKSHRLLGSYELAIAEAHKAESLYKETGNDVGVGKSRWTIAGVLRMQQIYEDALEECHRVKRIFDLSGYRAAIFLQHDYAEIYRAKNNFNKALEIYQMTMERTRSTGEQNRLAHSLLGIAETKRWEAQTNEMMSNSELNVDLYNEAMSIYEKMGVKWGIVVCLIGRALARLHYWELAKKDLNSALKIIETEPLPVEKQFIETILTERKSILLPLNWI